MRVAVDSTRTIAEKKDEAVRTCQIRKFFIPARGSKTK
jgi:hypothetical protein